MWESRFIGSKEEGETPRIVTTYWCDDYYVVVIQESDGEIVSTLTGSDYE